MNHFKTQYNGDNFDHSREVFTMESHTQPDQVMSINDMLVRHQNGLPVQGPRNPEMFYDAPEELGYVPDIKSMDLSEIHDLREELSARVREIKQRDKEKEDERIEQEKQQEIADRLNALKDQEPAPDPGEAGQQEA